MPGVVMNPSQSKSNLKMKFKQHYDQTVKRFCRMSYLEKSLEFDQQLDKIEAQLLQLQDKETLMTQKKSLKHQMKIIQ